MNPVKFILNEANKRMRNQNFKAQRVDKMALWLQNDEEKARLFKTRYLSLKLAMRRSFWLLLSRMDVNKALIYMLRLQKIATLASRKQGFKFKTKTGLDCVLKRLDKSEYATVFLQFEKRERTRYGVTEALKKYLANPRYFRYFVFIFKLDRTKFGLIYEFASREGKVSVVFLRVVDSVIKGDPRYPTFYYSYTFHENAIYSTYSRESTIIKESIKRVLPPQITSLIIKQKDGDQK
jgi:hypothetical protein